MQNSSAREGYTRHIPADTEDLQFEQAMRDSFITTAETVATEKEAYCKEKDAPILAGLELEFALVDQECNLAPESVRNTLTQQLGSKASIELAAHQIEIITTKPKDIRGNGWLSLFDELKQHETQMLSLLQVLHSGFVRIGCFPLSDIADVTPTSGYPRYIRSPLWHQLRQRDNADNYLGTRELVSCQNPYVVGLMNAVQITLDASSFSDAIDKINRALMISPIAVALSANARFLECKDTGLADLRMKAWSISHDVRTNNECANGYASRVGLPNSYYSNVHDYWNRVLQWPFILNEPGITEKAFEIGHGLCWRDARLKWFRDKKVIGVEFRPVSLQPTLYDDLCIMAFAVGRILWSQQTQEHLLPMQYVIRNKNNAERFGMTAELLHWNHNGHLTQSNVSEIAEEELTKSAYGLRTIGVAEDTIKILACPIERRIRNRTDHSKTLSLAIGDNFCRIRNKSTRAKVLREAMHCMGLIQPE